MNFSSFAINTVVSTDSAPIRKPIEGRRLEIDGDSMEIEQYQD